MYFLGFWWGILSKYIGGGEWQRGRKGETFNERRRGNNEKKDRID